MSIMSIGKGIIGIIMEPVNLMYFITIGVVAIFGSIVHKKLKNKSE